MGLGLKALLARPEFVRASERGGEPTIEMRRAALAWLVTHCSEDVVPLRKSEDVLAGRMGRTEVDGREYLLLTCPAEAVEERWIAEGRTNDLEE
jgi:hypothetical protein